MKQKTAIKIAIRDIEHRIQREFEFDANVHALGVDSPRTEKAYDEKIRRCQAIEVLKSFLLQGRLL